MLRRSITLSSARLISNIQFIFCFRSSPVLKLIYLWLFIDAFDPYHIKYINTTALKKSFNIIMTFKYMCDKHTYTLKIFDYRANRSPSVSLRMHMARNALQSHVIFIHNTLYFAWAEWMFYVSLGSSVAVLHQSVVDSSMRQPSYTDQRDKQLGHLPSGLRRPSGALCSLWVLSLRWAISQWPWGRWVVCGQR